MNSSPFENPTSSFRNPLTSHSEHAFGGLDPGHGERYLDATVRTASPARLRLMVIERAIEIAGSLAETWRGPSAEGGSNEQSLKLLELLNELLGGVTGESGEVGQKVADLYVFLIQHLLAAEENGDAGAVDEIAVVLQAEAETWRMVCANANPASPSGQAAPPASGGLNLHA